MNKNALVQLSASNIEICWLLSFLVMELRQLEYFVAVAEEESFTKAAARMHVAQSGVSAQILLLERELGQRLFGLPEANTGDLGSRVARRAPGCGDHFAARDGAARS